MSEPMDAAELSKRLAHKCEIDRELWSIASTFEEIEKEYINATHNLGGVGLACFIDKRAQEKAFNSAYERLARAAGPYVFLIRKDRKDAADALEALADERDELAAKFEAQTNVRDIELNERAELIEALKPIIQSMEDQDSKDKERGWCAPPMIYVDRSYIINVCAVLEGFGVKL